MDRKRLNRAARAAARGEAGMTLIEIMIVLAIIALVMGFLVGPKVLEALKESKVDIGKMEINQLANDAYGRWVAANPDDEDSCPDNIEALLKYTNKKVNKDPWGQKYVMQCGSDLPDGTDVGIISAGPDKKMGSDDDLRSWQLKK